MANLKNREKLKKSSPNNCKDIMTYSNFTGGKHLFETEYHLFERIFWMLLVGVSIFGIVYVCKYQWNHYLANPTVTALERDYHSWNGTLPAITICYNDGKLNSSKADEYIRKIWNITKFHSDYEYFLHFLMDVVNTSIGKFDKFLIYANDSRLIDIDLRQLIKEVNFKHDHNLITVEENMKVETRQIVTERGLCYSINSPITVLLENGKNVTKFSKPFTCSFDKGHCYLKIDVFEIESTIQLHSPYEVPLYDDHLIHIKRTDELAATYKVMETIASDSLLDLSVNQRKCVFEQELIGKSPIYSGNLCLMECRARVSLTLCRCRPFYYPFLDGPDCNLSGILCLHNNNWPFRMDKVCNCPKSCNELMYTETNFQRLSWVLGDLPFLQKSSFRWVIIPAKMRMRRDILFSYEDLIVSFGGAATLFLSCSFFQISRFLYIIAEKLLSEMNLNYWIMKIIK